MFTYMSTYDKKKTVFPNQAATDSPHTTDDTILLYTLTRCCCKWLLNKKLQTLRYRVYIWARQQETPNNLGKPEILSLGRDLETILTLTITGYHIEFSAASTAALSRFPHQPNFLSVFSYLLRGTILIVNRTKYCWSKWSNIYRFLCIP